MAVRETSIMADPLLSLVVGHQATWQSFFFYTREGDAIALVGNLDVEDYRRCGWFTEVTAYTEGVRDDFRKTIERLNPSRIALNYSPDNPAADGLTHGMYLTILGYLDGTDFADRLVSASDVCTKLRARKLDSEVDLVARAAVLADQAFKNVVPEFGTAMTEKEIGAVIDAEIDRLGSANSFGTIVNAGDKTSPGHGLPTDAKLEPGDLLHVDFGARIEGYCSDLQRLVYFRRPNEAGPPEHLSEAFEQVRDIITETAGRAQPGARGFEIDAIAREMLLDNGYAEYQHALGHQLGRAVHDGGAIIGPKWERYGKTAEMKLEAGNVFTLELEINLPGIGCVGLEEDVLIVDGGARFLCPRQLELIVV
ncbi:MAG: Xaa-Pro peptidase family protein [candidate division Zixibacteria bacterium]|nr:Xaa-Pro peptidase family protein [candidate division Zixibacteria bacterium]MDH3936773.1 Xaa-Pro peptidase family protein [candidate division Zixibacteria bacterium]